MRPQRSIALSKEQFRFLADRRFGIGADQILIVEASSRPNVDFRYRIYNADGGEVEQCGNGARAFVKFVTEKGLTDKNTIRVNTLSGMITPTLRDDGCVTVDMSAPILAPDQVPFDTTELQGKHEGEDLLWPLELDGDTLWISAVSMGNPHAVQVVADIDHAPVAVIGPQIERHARFPNRVNAGFMEIRSRHQIAFTCL